MPVVHFADLAGLVRTCEGIVFPTRTYENSGAAWQLLDALAKATDRRFHARLEASDVLGLEVDESIDCGDSNNIFMVLHYEVMKYFHSLQFRVHSSIH